MQDKQTGADRRTFLMTAAAGAAATVLPAATAHAKSVVQSNTPVDAITLASQLRKGDLTPLEALDAAIARVDALPKLNAVVIKNYDLARDYAKKLSAMGRDERQKATDTAPLWGLPFVLKDLGVSMAGTVSSNGCAFFKDAVAQRDSTLAWLPNSSGNLRSRSHLLAFRLGKVCSMVTTSSMTLPLTSFLIVVFLLSNPPLAC